MPKFQTVKNALEAEFEEALETSKWTLWHGNIQKTLTKLAEVQASLEDKKQQSKRVWSKLVGGEGKLCKA